MFSVFLKVDILVLRNTSSVTVALVIGVAPCALGCSLLCFSSPVSHCPWLTRLHTEPELCNLMSFLHMTCLLSKGSFDPRLLQSYRDQSRSYPAHLSLFLNHASRVGVVMDSIYSLHSTSASFYLAKANLVMPGLYSLGRTPPRTLLIVSLLLSHWHRHGHLHHLISSTYTLCILNLSF